MFTLYALNAYPYIKKSCGMSFVWINENVPIYIQNLVVCGFLYRYDIC